MGPKNASQHKTDVFYSEKNYLNDLKNKIQLPKI